MSDKPPTSISTEKSNFVAPLEVPTPNSQVYMAGGLRGWLDNIITMDHQTTEPLHQILPDERYPRKMTVVSGVEDARPRAVSRRTSRGSQLVRVKSSSRVRKDPATSPDHNAIIPSPRTKRLRLGSVIPFILSAAAFSFSLVLILAGQKTGPLTAVNLISFNTTNIGTGIIEFKATTATAAITRTATTSTAKALGRRQTTLTSTTLAPMLTPAPTKPGKRDFNPLDPFGLVPVISSAVASRASIDSSILASVGSNIASAGSGIATGIPSITLPGLALPTGLTSSNGTSGLLSGLGSLITQGLESLLSGIISGLGASGITSAIDDALNKAIADLISRLVASAGIEDYYSLYVLGTCSGNSSSEIKDCSHFSSTANDFSNISAKIPNHVVIAGTNVTSPALAELTDAIASLGPLVSGVEKFFLALMIISLINSALAIIFSFLGIFFPVNRIILYANVSLASIGILTRSIDAILATIISYTLRFFINKFGNAIGISASIGSVFIALVWLGFVCQLLASSFWVGVWFVEFRQTSFRLRRREVGEIGNYRGIFGELKSDIRSPTLTPDRDPEKNFVVV